MIEIDVLGYGYGCSGWCWWLWCEIEKAHRIMNANDTVILNRRKNWNIFSMLDFLFVWESSRVERRLVFSLTIPIPKLAIARSFVSVFRGTTRCSNITKEFEPLFKPDLWMLGNSWVFFWLVSLVYWLLSGDRDRLIRLRFTCVVSFDDVWSGTSQRPLILSCSAVLNSPWNCKRSNVRWFDLISCCE